MHYVMLYPSDIEIEFYVMLNLINEISLLFNGELNFINFTE